ncbi:hypothetical protein SDC9_155101 [bioreactor metagenome]|uniref:Uncharacterized protein n=1 Tax=bioreactor metagenome TaxID=1076179 RepID=A0A645F336_9ZZZZ
MTSRSTPSSTLMVLTWTSRILCRPAISGRSRTIWRSKRPGRSSAGSSTSGRLVAASTMTPPWVSRPSISTSNALRVCSRSSWPPPSPENRDRPTASISSMKIRHGALALAWSNISRTRLAPTPTNISTKSEPLIAKNGTPASQATALANRVLPVPGGPVSRQPRGILPPTILNFSGSRRKSTISRTSSFASSHPATSSKVTCSSFGDIMRARLLPNCIAPAPEFLNCRAKNIHSSTISIIIGSAGRI